MRIFTKKELLRKKSEILLKDTILFQLPKNVFQYLIGFSLYILTFNQFSWFMFFAGLLAFILTYSAIYPYNDMMDYEEDKKDHLKKLFKGLAKGTTTLKQASTVQTILIISGLFIGTLISKWYALLLITLLFTNWLHSSPQTSRHFKKLRLLIPNMFIMQYLKFTAGWFTFTTNISQLPALLITCLSLTYILGYLLYKLNIMELTKTIKKKAVFFGPFIALIIITYELSIIMYNLLIPLVMMLPIGFILIMANRRRKNVHGKTLHMSKITFSMIIIFVVLVLLLKIPVIGEINVNASQTISQLGEQTLESLPNTTYILIQKINESLYYHPINDLSEIENLASIKGWEEFLTKPLNN